MDEAYRTKRRLTDFFTVDEFVGEYMAKHGQDDTVQPPTEHVIRREFMEAHRSEWFQVHPSVHADFKKVLKQVLKSRSVLAKYWLRMSKLWGPRRASAGGQCVRVCTCACVRCVHSSGIYSGVHLGIYTGIYRNIHRNIL